MRSATRELLQKLVADGELQSFQDKEGRPRWGLPPTEHEHNWCNPSFKANNDQLRRSLLAGELLAVTWRCAVGGCDQHRLSFATLVAETEPGA
jgi:hypothetical protein